MNKIVSLSCIAALLALLLPVVLMAAEKMDGQPGKHMMPMDGGKMHGQGTEMMNIENGAALLQYITSAPYTKWRLMPGTTAMRTGKEPHGALQNVYVNGPAFAAITAKAGAMPSGAVIVKENYMPDKKLAAVTVMYKRKGYNPDGGDYMWLKFDADKKIQAEGKVQGCISCHTQAKANDFVILAPLK